MKAMILSGGRGKRLRPVTDTIPKPLIKINGKPLIEWKINYLKKFGIRDIIICSGYKGKKIENYITVETSPLGTGGAIKKAAKNIVDDSFIVLNGDIITNINLKKILIKSNSIAAIELRTNYGTMKIKNNKILQFNEKTDVKDTWMNGGIYHLNTDIAKILPRKGSIEEIVFPKLAKKNSLNTVKFKNVLWRSIDSHKDVETCSKEMIQKKYMKFISKR